LEFGLHKKFGFSSAYFDDNLIYSAVFTLRPLGIQLKSAGIQRISLE
jgi:hypothetical protein